MTDTKRETIKQLSLSGLLVIQDVFNKPVRSKYMGICSNYIYRIGGLYTPDIALYNLLINCCKELNYFSGDVLCPIESPYSNEDSFDAYVNAKGKRNGLWSKGELYGRRRWDVLNLMRSKIEAEINSRN